MSRTRKLPQKKVKRTPKLSKPTFLKKLFLGIGKVFKIILKPFIFILKPFIFILKPFIFILKPFKTRPARFIGRIIRKILLIDYIKSSWKEVRQVTWPGRKETIQLTFAVFIFAIGFGLMIAIVDYGLSKMFQQVFLK